MALNFPNTPTDGQVFYDATSGNRYVYNAAFSRWTYESLDPLLTSTNNQVIYNESNSMHGSNGLIFSANTLYANAINVYANVTAGQYVFGNGAFLTGISNDFSPAFNHANAAFIAANGAFNYVNSAYVIANLAFNSANAISPQVGPTKNTANAAFFNSNSAFGHANLAFDEANTVYTYVTNNVQPFMVPSFNTANQAYTQANNAYNTANLAWDTANTKLSVTGGSISGDLEVTGNLHVIGNVTFTNTNSLSVSDPLLYLASNNYTTDLVDIGIIANYVNTGGANVHTGIYREYTNKEWYLFQGYDEEPYNNHIDPNGNNFTLAILNADIRTSNLILGGANAIQWITNAYNQANLAASGANVGTAAPTGTQGSLWWDSASGRLFIYYSDGDSSQWVEASPAGAVDPGTITAYITPIYNVANSAFDYSRVAFRGANAAYLNSNVAHDKANVAYAQSNAAWDASNSSYGVANLVYVQANNASNTANQILANVASLIGPSYDTANGAFLNSNLAFGKANAALANATGTFAGSLFVSGNVSFAENQVLVFPYGTTAARPNGSTGMVRYNTSLNRFEGFATTWGPLGGGATGGPGDDVFYENSQNVTQDYTITTGKNAMSAGPIAINANVTVTIPSNSVWTIV